MGKRKGKRMSLAKRWKVYLRCLQMAFSLCFVEVYLCAYFIPNQHRTIAFIGLLFAVSVFSEILSRLVLPIPLSRSFRDYLGLVFAEEGQWDVGRRTKKQKSKKQGVRFAKTVLPVSRHTHHIIHARTQDAHKNPK